MMPQAFTMSAASVAAASWQEPCELPPSRPDPEAPSDRPPLLLPAPQLPWPVPFALPQPTHDARASAASTADAIGYAKCHLMGTLQV